MEVKVSIKSAATGNWTSLDNAKLRGRKQYAEMNTLSSGTNGKLSSSYGSLWRTSNI